MVRRSPSMSVVDEPGASYLQAHMAGGDSTGEGRARGAGSVSGGRLETALDLALGLAGMATLDSNADGTLASSPRLHAILGHDPGDAALPRTLDDVFQRIHAEDVGRVRAAYARATGADASVDVEFRIRRACGDYVWVRERARRLVETGGAARIVGVVADVGAQKRADERLSILEVELRHAEQQEQALRTLAGGIAHEFNNLLAPMLGNAQILRRAFETSDPRHVLMEDIAHAALKARDLVRRIVAFSRRRGSEGQVEEQATETMASS